MSCHTNGITHITAEGTQYAAHGPLDSLAQSGLVDGVGEGLHQVKLELVGLEVGLKQ
jgi:hypothetical protein